MIGKEEKKSRDFIRLQSALGFPRDLHGPPKRKPALPLLLLVFVYLSLFMGKYQGQQVLGRACYSVGHLLSPLL